ncbi:hypothetical protein GQ53DRAFT_753436 [Thozetella sp. PMI_491]|nr:hypothetical protein GQ53DRAFT_753436 [Thozetella sp. PMI_491]
MAVASDTFPDRLATEDNSTKSCPEEEGPDSAANGASFLPPRGAPAYRAPTRPSCASLSRSSQPSQV